MHLNHFTYGLLTPGLAYALSVLGSLLGLVCTVRARQTADPGRRARWLVLAAWAIGGTGMWVMHFVAMIGFSITGQPVRYDLSITVASWIVAIVVVGIGLFIVGFGRPSVPKVLAAGLFTGTGVAAMHYSGMAAMRTPPDVVYDSQMVFASVAIAVVAATVALWFTVTLRRGAMITLAAFIMGVAVSGMHYTGMFAMSLRDAANPVNGVLPISLMGPIVVFVVAVIVVLLVALLSRSDAENDQPTARLVDVAIPRQGVSRTSPAAFVSRPTR